MNYWYEKLRKKLTRRKQTKKSYLLMVNNIILGVHVSNMGRSQQKRNVRSTKKMTKKHKRQGTKRKEKETI